MISGGGMGGGWGGGGGKNGTLRGGEGCTPGVREMDSQGRVQGVKEGVTRGDLAPVR